MSLDDFQAGLDAEAATNQRITEHRTAQSALGCLLALHAAAPHVAVAVADAFLERVALGWPEAPPFFGQVQSEADWWAECATDQQMAAMLLACLKRLAKGQMIMAPNARKRALVAIWNSLPVEDKTAFIDFIEPGPGART